MDFGGHVEHGERLLSSHRMMPYRNLTFLVLKKRLKSNEKELRLDEDDHIDQLLDYADGLLRCDFRRRFTIVAATNGA